MTRWAASLPRSAAAGLGPLRFLAAEACAAGERIWLRGAELSDADELRLRQLSGAERFRLNERNELLPPGSLLPVGILPQAEWQPLRAFVQTELPPLRLVAATVPRLSLSLVRDSHQREVTALTCSLADWQNYALTAPQVRLAPLRFAASGTGHVLIVGNPLPPLAGERFWSEQGIFVAAGLHWSPAVDAGVVRRVLHLAAGEFALWHADGHWELLRECDLVTARRAAVRATAEAFSK